jgi:hypothetical protein
MPLKDKAAALDHALRIVRKVRAAANYEQTGLIIVRDEMQQIVLSIPILAAWGVSFASVPGDGRNTYSSHSALIDCPARFLSR